MPLPLAGVLTMRVVLAVAGCLFLVAAIGFAVFGRASPGDGVAAKPAPTFTISDADRDIGAQPTGVTIPLTYRIVNPSTNEVRLRGNAGRCVAGWCMKAERDDAVVIPAGGHADVTCSVLVSEAGPFSASMGLYLDDGLLHTVTVSAHGTGVSPAK